MTYSTWVVLTVAEVASKGNLFAVRCLRFLPNIDKYERNSKAEHLNK